MRHRRSRHLHTGHRLGMLYDAFEWRFLDALASADGGSRTHNLIATSLGALNLSVTTLRVGMSKLTGDFPR